MIVRPQDYLVRLRPRTDTLYASQSRTVLATDRDGLIRDGERGSTHRATGAGP